MAHNNTIFLCLITYFIISCDVSGIIHVENYTNNDAFYITYSEASSGIRDTILLEIPPDEARAILFNFGYRWTDKEIKEYFSTINKIEIITKSDTVAISDKAEMYNYFRKNRKGLSKRKIKIKIE